MFYINESGARKIREFLKTYHIHGEEMNDDNFIVWEMDAIEHLEGAGCCMIEIPSYKSLTRRVEILLLDNGDYDEE